MRKYYSTLIVPAALMVMGMSTQCLAADEDMPKEPAAGMKMDRQMPEAIAVTTMTATATVEAIDPAQRTVTLKGPEGKSMTYKCGPEVRNFDQIKVGDQVRATLIDSVAAFVRKSDMPPNVGEGAMVALAPKGARPGVVMAETQEITDRIMSVDAKARTITLEGTSGMKQTLHVGPNARIDDLKKGDDVTLRVTKALALMVEAPENAVPAAGKP